MDWNTVIFGDCIEEMKKLDDNSIDAIVSDPPYGLGFMNKDWDKFTPKEYQDFCEQWGKEAIRILKSGGYLLAFSGTRTYHRMVVGLEDAGFTIKDMIEWMYGSGFPKSLDISRAIDKYNGIEFSKGEKISDNVAMTGGNYTRNEKQKPITEEAKQWEGYGTSLKPAHEPIVVAQKPYEKTYANNVLKYGVGGLNIDACRIKYNSYGEDSRVYNKDKNISRGTHKNGTVNIAPDGNEMRMFKKEKGRFPSNVILTHHPECKLIGEKKVKTSTLLKEHDMKHNKHNAFHGESNKDGNRRDYKDYAPDGFDIVQDWECHQDCPIRILDEQSGNIERSGRPNLQGKDYKSDGLFKGGQMNLQHMDSGGASRFFYCGKAYKTERNAGLDKLYDVIGGFHNKSGRPLVCKCERCKKEIRTDGRKNRCKCEEPQEYYPEVITKNNIATLKPINLMRYLVRLITPPKGIVLDPFAGSGTTGIACIIEDFNYILIEKREEFAKIIIPERLKWWSKPENWKILKGHPELPEIEKKIKTKKNKSIETFF